MNMNMNMMPNKQQVQNMSSNCPICTEMVEEDFTIFLSLFRYLLTNEKSSNTSFVCLKIDDKVERILRSMVYSQEFTKVIEEIFKYKYPNRIIFNNSCDHIYGINSIISYMKQYSSNNFIHTASTADLNEEFYRRRLISMQKDLQSIRTKLDKYEGPLCEMAKNMKNDLNEKNLVQLFDEEDHKNAKNIKTGSKTRATGLSSKGAKKGKRSRQLSTSKSQLSDNSEKYTETKSINGTTGSSVGKQLEIFFDGGGEDNKKAKEKEIEEEEERNNNELKKRKFSKSKLPKEATDILQGWFLLNISSPYPDNETKNSLMKMTGLSKMQLENWFTNNRKPLKDHSSLNNIVDLNKNDFLLALPKDEVMNQNMASNVMSQPMFDPKGGYVLSNAYPNIPQQQQISNFPFTYFDSRYQQIAQPQPYAPNTQIYSPSPYNFNNEMNMNNKITIGNNFDMNKGNPEDVQRSNVGGNFMNVPMVGYPVYSPAAYQESRNVNPNNYDFFFNNRNFINNNNNNNIQAYPYQQVQTNNMMDMNNFQVNRQNIGNMNNSFIISNQPPNKQFYVSYLPENAMIQEQVLPDSGSGQEKTEEEEEDYTPMNVVDKLVGNNN